MSSGYPTLCPQLFSGPRRCCSPPPCTSPLLDYQQPNASPYDFVNGGCTSNGVQGLQYREHRRNSTGMMPDSYRCARILNVELEKPRKKSSAAAALLVKVSRYPEHLDPIPCAQLLHMFQHLYGSMLDTVKNLTRDLLRIEDLNAVSCRATVYRFDKRDTWRVYKSRSGVQDHFYCAPHIEVTLPYFPTRAAIKEIIAAVMDSYGALGKHMQPAFKFRTRTYSWKFEPGTVYESIDAEHFIAKPVADEEEEEEDISQEEEHQSEPPRRKAITYPGYTTEGGSDTSPGDGVRKLDDIKEELRFGPNKDQCRETVKTLLANEFMLDPRRITVWFWVKDVQLHDGKWYPWGSLDNTYGLTIASQEVVNYSQEDAKRSAKRASRSGRTSKDKELRDIAPTVRVTLPVERTKFAKDEENVKGLKECVQSIRSQMSTISTCHSRAAFCISWRKEKREFADWIVPQVVYKPTGDGDTYVLEDTGASQR
ncbi:hypothetical protein O1611_g536 [Lasiodiplodia mahajangana]|uniref:Uncharacterized protein n=1 Tax=Lasiodiplodia mahajangana TaxID=1108764 RepID=A0ACC2K0A1_9PEZI|nr:hypothetical protein O1611_g536 [Lasiodiplodia mahajangana]